MQTNNLLDKLQAPTAVDSGDLLASPRRIQLSRKAGWKMPPNTVVVSRPSKWGNPFKVGTDAFDAFDAVDKFENWLITTNQGLEIFSRSKTELRGKNLACWCKLGTPCHADVLLRLANEKS